MDWGNLLFGGQGQNLGDYQQGAQYQDRGQILGYVGQGMSNINGTGPQLDPNQQAAARAMQMQQAQQLQRIASGQQQGAGELAVQRQMANAQAAQQAQAMMARGNSNAGLAMRNAATNQAGIGLSGAGQSQQAALADQQMAQGQLSGALGGMRGQDIGFAGQNANLQQQQYGLNTQRGLGYLGQLGNMNQGQLGAQTSAYNATQGNQGYGGMILGGMLKGGSTGGAQAIAGAGGGGGAAVASDERLKTDVRPGGHDIDEMMDKLTARTYRYKDDVHGKGERVGVMAQDMERSKMGAGVVREMPYGKGLDVNRALSAALAATARLNERLRKVERKRG